MPALGGYLGGGGQDAPEGRFVPDPVVRGQDGHDVIAGPAPHHQGGQADTRGGVAAHRLDENVFLGDLRELGDQLPGMGGPGDDEDLFRRRQGEHPGHRFLDDGLFAANI